MPVKKFNPVTPGTRQRVANAFTELTSATPEKSLIAKQSKSGGRNNEGHRTVRYKGGGHKRRYRVIDFKRDKEMIPQKLNLLSTIQTEQHSLLCWSIRMVRNVIS